eukprot:TRINITY_DN10165_c0_g1_i1.p1 TRINITY_DN10165_c0_g1~~TRINITY_DN10165_c0_g1_i1.p1  ORF type:complete len:391 (+),score=94.46 TRINITY_DN10165_c0_g1_i1:119-1291(+)
MKWLSLGLFCLQNSLNSIIFRFAMTEADSSHRPSTSLVLFCTEFLKLFLSFLLLCNEERWDVVAAGAVVQRDAISKPRESARLGVPAVIYLIQNTLLQLSSGNLPATVWQVTYQGKIVVTALFSVLLLQKVIKRVQWLAIAVMGLGIAIVQLSNAKEKGQADMGNASEQDVVRGFVMLVLAASCSGFASVYTEMVFKQVGADPNQKKLSVWLQNMQLASFSCLFVGLAYVAEVLFPADGRAEVNADREFALFPGFTTKTWSLVLNNAIGGLLVAMVIKYADNLLRGFASAIATINCAVLSVFCFSFELAPSFALGSIMVIGSTLLYGNILKLPGEWWNSELRMLSVAVIRPEKRPSGESFASMMGKAEDDEECRALPRPSPRQEDAAQDQ